MAKLIVTINSNQSAQDLRNSLSFSRDKTSGPAFLKGLAGSLTEASGVEVQLLNANAVASSGTFSYSDVASADDTVIINNVTFTAKASGATGNQFNTGLTASASAANLTAAIKASASAGITSFVTASVSSGVVTIKALKTGVAGNTISISKGVDSGSVVTVSGALLTGGTDDTASSVSYKNW